MARYTSSRMMLVGGGGNFATDGVMEVDLDLNGAYGLILDADGDSKLYANADDDIYFTSNGSMRFRYNNNDVLFAKPIRVDGQRIYDNAGALNLGTAASTGHGLGAGDVIVGGKLEVDGIIYGDSLIYANGSTSGIGTPGSNELTLITGGSAKAVLRASAFELVSNIALGWTNSAGVSSNTYLTRPAVGNVGVKIVATGQTTVISHKTETVTFAADPGSGTAVTTGSIIPAGAFVVGVSGRVTTADTSGQVTSMDIGIAHKDTDAFGDGIALTLGTTFTTADGNASADYSAAGLGIQPSMTDQEITITGVGGDGNAEDLAVAITVHYIDVTAATSA